LAWNLKFVLGTYDLSIDKSETAEKATKISVSKKLFFDTITNIGFENWQP